MNGDLAFHVLALALLVFMAVLMAGMTIAAFDRSPRQRADREGQL